ncbi:MAG TPA: MFS transporter [Stellaceae bacterium]|nr:MFS transporter [Stellaceae bacterium]
MVDRGVGPSLRPRRYPGMAERIPTAPRIVETDIPARLDRLPWTGFHTLVVVALGVTWVLDGLEVTLAGSIAGALQESPVLRFTAAEVGLVGSAYLLGAVTGAVLFGYLTDRFGRKRLFFVTLGLYLCATAATALAWDFWSFAAFRLLTGAGIGGEYTAINSAIQELVPARLRGRTDLAINGSFWIGAALGAGGAVAFLQPGALPPDWGWRAGFGVGAVLGLVILALRRFVPESPRWLMLHDRLDEAETVVAAIERRVVHAVHAPLPAPGGRPIRLAVGAKTPIARMVLAILRDYPRRALLGLALMAAQAFFYNAIFFSYALVLKRFYGVPAGSVGWYILPFALGNFLGPLFLGPLFDKIGRKPMISATYALSGLLLAIVGWLFYRGLLDASTLTLCWSGIFFFASAAASAAYLTVSESFPLEARALAIALFYALGTALGGVAAPWLFGILVGSGERGAVFAGYLLGAALMLGAALTEAAIGVKAERMSLENVARPISSVGE